MNKLYLTSFVEKHDISYDLAYQYFQYYSYYSQLMHATHLACCYCSALPPICPFYLQLDFYGLEASAATQFHRSPEFLEL